MAANEHAGTRTRMRTIAITSAIVVAVVLVTSVSWRASQAQEMRPALRTSNAEQTLRLYLRARAGGYYGVANEALHPTTRRELAEPNVVPDYSDLLMRDLRLEGPNFGMRPEQPGDVQFVVRYASVFRSSTGDPPGQRFYFAYVTQDPEDGRWYVRGLGTGP